MARPAKYLADTERPVSLSLRIPRDIYDQAQHLAHMRRTSLTEIVIEGLRLRLDTPDDPRDIVVSQDITAMQELERMIDERISAALAAHALALATAPAPPAPARVHDGNITVMQGNVSVPQRARKGGRPSILRQPILELLRQHPEGLSALELKVHLKTDKHIGDTLAGMRRSGVVKVEGEGNRRRYFAMDEPPS